MKKYLILFLLLLTPLSQASTKEKRFAFVVGNIEYKNIKPLYNAINDAQDMRDKLKKMDFDVDYYKNLNTTDLKHEFKKFTKKLIKADNGNSIALIFYAGHGVELNAVRYIVPVDFDFPDATLPIHKQEDLVIDQLISIKSLDSLMKRNKSKVNIILYDACSNNPFKEQGSNLFTTYRSFGNVSNNSKNKDVSKIVSKKDGFKGTFYAFGTSSNEKASDGDGELNGLFTKYILKNIDKKGYNILEIFTKVQNGVQSESDNRQTANFTSSLVGDFYFHQGDNSHRDIIIEKRPKWIMPLLIGCTFLLLMTAGYTLKQRRKIAWANEVILKGELKRDKTILDDEIEKSHLIRDQIVGYLKDIKTDKIITLVQSGDKITLGREKPADFVVDDKVISGEHCEISYNPSNKTFQVKDLNSSNGIWLSEDQQLKAGKKHTLKDGQVFYLANEDHPLVLVKSDK